MSKKDDEVGAPTAGAPTNGAPATELEGEVIHPALIMAARIELFTGQRLSEHKAEELIQIMIREQQMLEEQIFPSIADTKERLKYPSFGVSVEAHGVGSGFNSLKLMRDVLMLPSEKRAEAALLTAMLIAFLTDGITARAALKIFGFTYNFQQGARQDQRIVLA